MTGTGKGLLEYEMVHVNQTEVWGDDFSRCTPRKRREWQRWARIQETASMSLNEKRTYPEAACLSTVKVSAKNVVDRPEDHRSYCDR